MFLGLEVSKIPTFIINRLGLLLMLEKNTKIGKKLCFFLGGGGFPETPEAAKTHEPN